MEKLRLEIEVVGNSEYTERLYNKLAEKSIGTKLSKQNEIKEKTVELSECKYYLIEWNEKRRKCKSKAKINIEERLIYLVEKLPLTKEDKVLEGHNVLEKYIPVDEMLSYIKILDCNCESVQCKTNNSDRTQLSVSLVGTNSRRKLIRAVSEENSNKEILFVDLERWIKGELTIAEKDFKKFLFYYLKGRENIVYAIKEFCNEPSKGIYQFNYSQYENFIFTWEEEKVKRLINEIKQAGLFDEIVIILGECNFHYYKRIVEMGSIIYDASKEEEGKTELEEEVFGDLLKSKKIILI